MGEKYFMSTTIKVSNGTASDPKSILVIVSANYLAFTEHVIKSSGGY